VLARPGGSIDLLGAFDRAVTALHPILGARYSPTSFDPGHVLDEPDVALLLEAARWAPSAGNSQPWSFIFGRRGEPTHARLVPHLAGSSARWAAEASLLVANLAHRLVETTDWEYSEFALYDLGQAVAHMTFQAQARGLHARQFRAFDREALEAAFEIPPHWQLTTMTAFGRPARTRPHSQRREPRDLVWDYRSH
jgi:nitroreductase